MLIYRATNTASDGTSTDLEEAKRDAGFEKDAGFDEDREAACAIQGTLDTKAYIWAFRKGDCAFPSNSG